MVKTTMKELMRYVGRFKHSVEADIVADRLETKLEPGQSINYTAAGLLWATMTEMAPLRPNLQIVADNDKTEP
jgi:hypothetical protein